MPIRLHKTGAAVLLALFFLASPSWGAGSAAKGKEVYMTTCIACHNMNPAKDGAVGPAIKGSSRALLEARIVRAAYPPGYKPKRPTAIMPPYPHLKDSVADLGAFLR
jgi:mono/diheme cytochrome c family protein